MQRAAHAAWLEEIICCPRCKSDLQYSPGGSNGHNGNGAAWACGACGARWPVEGEVLDSLSNGHRNGNGNGRARSDVGQFLMELAPVVRLYESRFWRSSKIYGRLMGIRLVDEIALMKSVSGAGPEAAVLDLACGPGFYAHSYAEDSPSRRVVGLDLSRQMLKHAARHARGLGMGNVAFIHGDAQELPFRDGAFDAANCAAALHLFPDMQRVLAELHRVIKPRGRLCITVGLATRNPLNRLKAVLDAPVWGVRYYRPEEAERFLDEAGFEPRVHHAKGFWMVASGVRRE